MIRQECHFVVTPSDMIVVKTHAQFRDNHVQRYTWRWGCGPPPLPPPPAAPSADLGGKSRVCAWREFRERERDGRWTRQTDRDRQRQTGMVAGQEGLVLPALGQGLCGDTLPQQLKAGRRPPLPGLRGSGAALRAIFRCPAARACLAVFPWQSLSAWLAAVHLVPPQRSDSRRPSRHLPRLQLAVAEQAGYCRPSARVVVELRGRLAPPLLWRTKTEASSQPLRLGSPGSSATAAHPSRHKTGSCCFVLKGNLLQRRTITPRMGWRAPRAPLWRPEGAPRETSCV